MRVAIISPVYDDYPAPWVQSVFVLIGTKIKTDEGNVSFSFISPSGNSNITDIRNACLQQLIIGEYKSKTHFDYILFIDCDIAFTPDDITKVLSHKKDIVSGLYFEKSPPCKPVAGFYRFDPKTIHEGLPRINSEQIKEKKLIEVDWTGMGFVLMKRDILEKLEYPWFDLKTIVLPIPIQKTPTFTVKKEKLSEDITFWTKFKELNYKIYVDTSIKLKHIGKYPYSEKDYFSYAK